MIFEQLALALIIFKPGGGIPPHPPPRTRMVALEGMIGHNF